MKGLKRSSKTRINIPEKEVYRGLYEFVVFLRVVIPLLIFKYPLVGIVGSFSLDALDAEVAAHKIMPQGRYEIVDKFLDFWWYGIIFVYVVLNLPQYIYLIAPLLVLRAIGDTFFLFKRNRKFLFYFPNLYEYAFVVIFLGTYFSQLNFLVRGNYLYFWLVIVFVIKIFHEYWLNVLEGSANDKIFHIKKRWLKKERWE